MSTEIKKRYLVIAVIVILICFIFGDQLVQTKIVDKQITQEQETDSLMVIATEKIQRIQEVQNKQEHDQSVLEMVLQHQSDGVDTKELQNKISELKKLQEQDKKRLVTLMKDTTKLRRDDTTKHVNVKHKDSIVYNVINKDTTIYNPIEKDTVHKTVYLADTVLVDPKYIKNKFYKQ